VVGKEGLADGCPPELIRASLAFHNAVVEHNFKKAKLNHDLFETGNEENISSLDDSTKWW